MPFIIIFTTNLVNYFSFIGYKDHFMIFQGLPYNPFPHQDQHQ